MSVLMMTEMLTGRKRVSGRKSRPHNKHYLTCRDVHCEPQFSLGASGLLYSSRRGVGSAHRRLHSAYTKPIRRQKIKKG